MKSAEQFLDTLFCGATTLAKPNPTTILPPEIEFAASRGLKLAPVRGLSRFASAARTRIGYPTADIVQLRSFAVEFPMCNWAMEADDMIVLEYNPELGQHSLRELCDGDWDGWRDTLQFRGSGATRFLLFRQSEHKLRTLGSRSAGLRLHSRDMVLAPPSRFLTGPPLAWLDLSAPIEDIPWWLIEPHGRGDQYQVPHGYSWHAGRSQNPAGPEDWGSGRPVK